MTNVTLKALRASLADNARERSAFEIDKNAGSTIPAQIDRHFAINRETGESKWGDPVIKALRDAGLQSFDFINDSLREGQRCNVKSFEKFSAHARSLAAGRFVAIDKTAQKYCVCILHDFIAKQREYSERAVTMTPARAQAMFSMGARKDALASYDFASMLNMQPSTASTQASSSLRALASLGVVAWDEGRKTIESVNWDHPLITLARELFDIPAPDAESDA